MIGQFLDVDGCRTHYIDVGNGPAVVLLHGASLAIDGPTTWASLIDVLAAKFRVITFDQIGFGQSDFPPDGRLWNRLERVPHACRFLDLLGIKQASLVGHSEGAFVAARVALIRPGLANALVVVASGGLAPRLGGASDADWVEASKVAYTYGPSADTEDGFINQSRCLTYAPKAQLERQLRENYRRPQIARQLSMFRSVVRGPNYPQDYTSLQETKIFPQADELPDTLLVWGASDPTVPVSRAAALQKVLKRADLHVFSESSHMVMYDRERDFNSLVQYRLEQAWH